MVSSYMVEELYNRHWWFNLAYFHLNLSETRPPPAKKARMEIGSDSSSSQPNTQPAKAKSFKDRIRTARPMGGPSQVRSGGAARKGNGVLSGNIVWYRK